jgi:hypothetical protein
VDLAAAADSITVGEVAASIIVGGGGVSVLNNLFQQSARIDMKDQGLEAVETLLRAETEENDA